MQVVAGRRLGLPWLRLVLRADALHYHGCLDPDNLSTDRPHEPDDSNPQAIPTASSLSHVGKARTSFETLERGLAWERAGVRNCLLERRGGGEESMRLRGGLGAKGEEWVDSDEIILSAPVEKAIAMVEKYAVVGVIVRRLQQGINPLAACTPCSLHALPIQIACLSQDINAEGDQSLPGSTVGDQRRAAVAWVSETGTGSGFVDHLLGHQTLQVLSSFHTPMILR